MPLIKRYANRKLYDTQAGQYVTLEDIGEFIRRGEDIQVVDHESGRDLTSLTLTQVLFQEEKRIGELLPKVVLTRLIRTGGDTLESLRERMLAAFDPQSLVDAEIRRRLESLAARGELAAEEAVRLAEKLAGPPEQWDVTHAPAAEPPAQEPDDLQALLQQVEALEKELAALKDEG